VDDILLLIAITDRKSGFNIAISFSSLPRAKKLSVSIYLNSTVVAVVWILTLAKLSTYLLGNGSSHQVIGRIALVRLLLTVFRQLDNGSHKRLGLSWTTSKSSNKWAEFRNQLPYHVAI